MNTTMNMSINKGAYLAFWHDFLTVSYFAEYHGWHETKAKRKINKGRVVFNEEAYQERSK